jgi:hypothetical protein
LRNHYYFVSSLPLLSYEERAAGDPADFIANAASYLTEREVALVGASRIDAPETVDLGTRTGTEYARFERGLRNALVRLRAANRGSDPEEYIRTDQAGNDESDTPGLRELARQAVAEESALAAEDMINRARWERLDELESGHYFDTERLVVYHLKLQVLARRRSFVRSRGEERYRQASEHITNEYYREHEQS